MSRANMELESLSLLHGQTVPAPEVHLVNPGSPSTGTDPELQGQKFLRDFAQQWERLTQTLEPLSQTQPDVYQAAVKEANQFSELAEKLFAPLDFPHQLHLKKLPELKAPHVQYPVATAPSRATAQLLTAELANHQCRTSSPDVEVRLITEEARQAKTEKLYDEIAAIIPDTLTSSEELEDLPRLISLIREAIHLPTPIDIGVLRLLEDDIYAKEKKLTARLKKLENLKRWANQINEKQPGNSSINTLRKVLSILHRRLKMEVYSQILLGDSRQFLEDQGRDPEDIAQYLAVDGSNIWLQSLMQHVQSYTILSKESIRTTCNKMTALQEALQSTLDAMWVSLEEREGQPSDQTAEAETHGEEPQDTQHQDSQFKEASMPASGKQHKQGDGGQQRDDKAAGVNPDVISLSDRPNHKQEAPDSPPSPRGSSKQIKKHACISEETAGSQQKRLRLDSSNSPVTTTNGMDKQGAHDGQVPSHDNEDKDSTPSGDKVSEKECDRPPLNSHLGNQMDNAPAQLTLAPARMSPGNGLSPEYIQAREVVRDLLAKAEQTHSSNERNLFAQYCERIYLSRKGTGEAIGQPDGITYYEHMATISYCKLCNTSITIKPQFKSKKMKEVRYSKDDIAKIITTVFSDIFPDMLGNVIRAIEGFLADPGHTYTGTHTRTSVLDKPPRFNRVLKAEEVHTQMRYLHHAVQMHRARKLVRRVVDSSSADINVADVGYIDIDLHSRIKDICNDLALSGKKGTAGVSLGFTRVNDLWFSGDPEDIKTRSEKAKRDTDIVFALVCVFSVSCIWMNPAPFPKIFEGRVSSLPQIFNIIKHSDSLGVVQEICDRFEDLTMSYTEAVPRLNVSPGIQNELRAGNKLQCIMQLVEDNTHRLHREVE